jgi:hypothetical protein
MAQFFTSANVYQGRGAAESGGAGIALGDILEANAAGNGADAVPSFQPMIGGVNHKSIGVFADESTGDNTKAQPAAFLKATLQAQTGAARFVVQRPGLSPLVIDQCCYAGPSASGNVLIAPSDVGTGPGQVNPIPQLQKITQLQQFPRVFLRSSANIRGIVSQISADEQAGTIGALDGPVVYSVDDAPKYSIWVLIIDGSAQQLIFPHPAGSDFRRPADIWARVVVPEIQRRNSNADPFPVWRDAGGASLINRGYVTRLAYVQYARLAGYDPAVTLTPIGRNPGPPPGDG